MFFASEIYFCNAYMQVSLFDTASAIPYYLSIIRVNCILLDRFDYCNRYPRCGLAGEGREGKAPPSPDPMWPRQLLLSRAFASQAGAYVILAGGLHSKDDVPGQYRELASRYKGDSYIIDPRGEVIAGPAEGETILLADGCMEEVLAAKSAFDCAGHYSRPDIFQLLINRGSQPLVVEKNHGDPVSGMEETDRIPDGR